MELMPKIKERRMENHLSQKDLCNILDMSQSQLSSLENGKYQPSLKSAFRIAKELHCKVDDLFEVVE